MTKMCIIKDELFPYFILRPAPNPFGKPLDIPEEKLTKMKQIETDFFKMQDTLKEMYCER